VPEEVLVEDGEEDMDVELDEEVVLLEIDGVELVEAVELVELDGVDVEVEELVVDEVDAEGLVAK